MRLVDRLSQNGAGTPVPETGGGSLIGGTPARKRDDIGEGSRRLKIRVHNRLLEMLDVSKLDALEPAMVFRPPPVPGERANPPAPDAAVKILPNWSSSAEEEMLFSSTLWHTSPWHNVTVVT